MSVTLLIFILFLVALQLSLQVIAAIDMAKRKRVRGGNRWVWVVAILLGLPGVLAYYLFGRVNDTDPSASTSA
jgi:hypothetical protein